MSPIQGSFRYSGQSLGPYTGAAPIFATPFAISLSTVLSGYPLHNKIRLTVANSHSKRSGEQMDLTRRTRVCIRLSFRFVRAYKLHPMYCPVNVCLRYTDVTNLPPSLSTRTARKGNLESISVSIVNCSAGWSSLSFNLKLSSETSPPGPTSQT